VIYDPAASGDLDLLHKTMQTYILETFFTPVLAPGEPKTNRIQDVLRSTVLTPSMGFKRRELRQNELRLLSFETSRVTAMEREIYPQAKLLAMISAGEVGDYIQNVNSDNDLFYRQLDD
jgi:hypothetical protein